MHYLSAQDQKQVLRKDLKSKRCRLSLLPSVLKMNHDESPWGQGCTDIVATYVGHLVLWQASHATGDRQTYSFVCICIRNQKGVCQQTTIDGVVHWVWQGENCTTPSSMELFSNLIFSNVSFYLIWWVVSYLYYPISKDYFHQHSLSATGGCRDEARSRHASKVLTAVLKRMIQTNLHMCIRLHANA